MRRVVANPPSPVGLTRLLGLDWLTAFWNRSQERVAKTRQGVASASTRGDLNTPTSVVLKGFGAGCAGLEIRGGRGGQSAV